MSNHNSLDNLNSLIDSNNSESNDDSNDGSIDDSISNETSFESNSDDSDSDQFDSIDSIETNNKTTNDIKCVKCKFRRPILNLDHCIKCIGGGCTVCKKPLQSDKDLFCQTCISLCTKAVRHLAYSIECVSKSNQQNNDIVASFMGDLLKYNKYANILNDQAIEVITNITKMQNYERDMFKLYELSVKDKIVLQSYTKNMVNITIINALLKQFINNCNNQLKIQPIKTESDNVKKILTSIFEGQINLGQLTELNEWNQFNIFNYVNPNKFDNNNNNNNDNNNDVDLVDETDCVNYAKKQKTLLPEHVYGENQLEFFLEKSIKLIESLLMYSKCVTEDGVHILNTIIQGQGNICEIYRRVFYDVLSQTDIQIFDLHYDPQIVAHYVDYFNNLFCLLTF